jgi:hypothetical protein
LSHFEKRTALAQRRTLAQLVRPQSGGCHRATCRFCYSGHATWLRRSFRPAAAAAGPDAQELELRSTGGPQPRAQGAHHPVACDRAAAASCRRVVLSRKPPVQRHLACSARVSRHVSRRACGVASLRLVAAVKGGVRPHRRKQHARGLPVRRSGHGRLGQLCLHSGERRSRLPLLLHAVYDLRVPRRHVQI